MSKLTGVAFVSLVTSSEDAYKQAIAFYGKLGFKPTRFFTKHTNTSFEETVGVSSDSLKECWLEAVGLSPLVGTGSGVHRQPLQEATGYELRDNVNSGCSFQSDGAVIKLRLSAANTLLYEELASEAVFFSTDLQRVKENFPHYESENDVLYVKDPIGNRVGFTNKPSPFAEKIESPEWFLHPKLETKVEGGSDEQKKIAQSQRRKIAVMTSGGDSPGMNPAVRAVVRAGIFHGCDMFAVYEGYTGLVEGGDLLRPMKWEDVRGWSSIGGTSIGTARCMEFRERWGRLQAAFNMVENGIDALVVCGGDGSLTGADLFREQWPDLLLELKSTQKISEEQYEKHKSLQIVGLVGSIDNDMAMTDSTIGAASSLERICEMVDYIDSTASSHSRAFVVEVMGRHCGWLGLMSGIATGADFIFIPERPPKAGKWQDELRAVCKRHRHLGRRKTTVIVAEGAIDDELHPITSDDVKDVLVDIGLDTRITTLGHVQRGGTAVAFDRMLATLQGVEAVKAVLDMTPETASPMIGFAGNKVVRRPLMESVKETKAVAEAIERKDFDGAMALRDSEFARAYDNFLSVSVRDDGKALLPEEERITVGIVHVGAASSALNAATRAAALYCLSKGHRVLAIQDGFSGLATTGSVRELQWLDVEEWHNLGGSEIGTNRTLPSVDMGAISFQLQRLQVDGLMVIGGFEAFHAVQELQKGRREYPQLGIPIVCVPSTVSNNVPGTEYSLGSDTCLNTLVNYCDAVKQSASASRRRVFVVEVQGGNCGYVASYAGLVTGSLAVYTPESRVDLKSLREDVRLLRNLFDHDTGNSRSGRLVVRNEHASDVFTTQLIADLIREEGRGKFESRTAVPGHVQQGKVPSSLDRVTACRFAIRSVQFIEECASQMRAKGPAALTQLRTGKETAVVLCVDKGKIQFKCVKELWEKESDHKNRKGTIVHWDHMNQVNDILSGRLMLRREYE